ncbi:MAG: hypothetical protein ACON31_00130 [Candidatus Puniceispirillaceae bacterium]
MSSFFLEHQVVTQIANLAEALERDYLKADSECEVSEEYDEAMFHHTLRSVITTLKNSADNLRVEFGAG